MSKDDKFWALYNHLIMCYEGNEAAAYSHASSELGYEPSSEENGL